MKGSKQGQEKECPKSRRPTSMIVQFQPLNCESRRGFTEGFKRNLQLVIVRFDPPSGFKVSFLFYK